MPNKELKLNKKIFNEDCEQIPIRKGFGEGLLAVAEKDERVVGLCADLTDSTKMDLFKKKFPERFIEIGVAEQNLASVASGLAGAGKIPFISSYAVFSPGRNWEQIRTTICYNNVPVKIAGSHAGVSVGPDGGSHQALEDIAITRVLPRMTVLTPCDAIEAKKATIEAIKIDGPVYIRLAREATPIITTEETPFEIGEAQIFYSSQLTLKSDFNEGKIDVGIIAIGALVFEAMRTAQELEKEGISVSVMNLGTVKPIDEKAVIDLAKEAGAIVTVEEHQIMGGMGSAVAEVLSVNFPIPIEFVGIKDVFGQSGTPDELLSHYSLKSKNIREAVMNVLKRKKSY